MNRGVLLRLLASLAFSFEIFVLLVSRPAAVGQPLPSQRPQPRPLPPMTQRIYAPLPTGGWQDVELVLNNNRPDTLTVRPTLFSGGVAAMADVVTLAAGEARWLRLSDLAPSAGRAATQNDAVELEYFGHALELGAQVALLRGRGAGVVDIPFSMPGEGRSLIQEATWPVGAGSRAVAVLGNASEAFVFATIAGPDRAGERIELPPHGTRTIVREASANPASPVDWLRVEVQGPTGSVRATGYVEAKNRVAAAIRFYDPEAARQADLFATNLRVADTWPTLVLKNTANMTITATPVFTGVKDDGELPVALPSIVLPPYAAVTVPLHRLQDEAGRRPDLGRVSLHVRNSGPPGTLIGSLSAASKDGTTAFDVPLREPGPLRKSTGSYPWRTDGDYNTLVTITNVADTPAQFIAFLTYGGGGQLELPMQELAPGATATFDLRQMRDRLSGVTSGQFRWSLIRSGGETKLVGRAEVVNVRDATATSYSCEVCCTWNPLQGFLTPSDWPVVIGGMGDAIIHEPYADCYGWVHDSTFGLPGGIARAPVVPRRPRGHGGRLRDGPQGVLPRGCAVPGRRRPHLRRPVARAHRRPRTHRRRGSRQARVEHGLRTQLRRHPLPLRRR